MEKLRECERVKGTLENFAKDSDSYEQPIDKDGNLGSHRANSRYFAATVSRCSGHVTMHPTLVI